MIMHYAGIQGIRNSETQKFKKSEKALYDSATLSNSDDTVLLQKHLNAINQYIKDCEQGPLSVVCCPLTLDCNNAGTVFRFLMTAVANLYLGVSVTRCLGVLLTGSERMKSRPIDSLVDALRNLGVSIEYQGREGYPPILISSTNLANHPESSSNNPCDPCDTWRLEISAEQSSQFASSLLLAAPLWKNGLELHLTGNLSSLPYIDMTIAMMRQCGIDAVRNDRDIMVKPGCYNVENIKVEPDWSAAAFWYEIASFSDNAEILLKNLNINSLQADAAAIKMFESLGVETLSVKEGVLLKKVNSQRSTVNGNSSVGCQLKVQSSESTFNFQLSTFNFKDCPDLFPAVIAACAGNKVNATFTGLKNLSIKESDRKRAMMKELSKINIAFEDVSDDELKMFCPEELPYFTEESPIVFDNYEDHRIAMALSVLSMKIGTVSMENTEVVSKSYPGFFDTL